MSESPKIQLYVARKVSEKVNATFDFVKENWRVWLRYSTYLLLPLAIVQGMGLNEMMNSLFDDLAEPGTVSIVATVVAAFIAMVMNCTLTLALLRLYLDRDDRLRGVTGKDLLPLLKNYAPRLLGAVLVLLVVFSPLIAVAVLLAVLIPLVGWVGFFVLLPLALVPAIYLYERQTLVNSVRRAFKLGFADWGRMVGLGLIMLLVYYVLTGCLTQPWAVCMAIKANLFDNSISVETKLVINIAFYVLTILYSFAMYLASSFIILAMTFHYGSVAADTEDASLDYEIENFEKL